MNGPKPCGSSSGRRVLSPKRRRPRQAAKTASVLFPLTMNLRPENPPLTPPRRGTGQGARAIDVPLLGGVRGGSARPDNNGRFMGTKREKLISGVLTPALTRRRERNIHPCFGDTTELGCRVSPKRKTKKRGLQPQRPNFPAPSQSSPSPGGEGWGEGKGSKLQSQAHDDFRNCQTSRVPRQSREFPI
jgi:hypothetical protein